MYRCEYFKIEELVPKILYENTDNPDLLWLIFDKKALTVLDYLRRDYGTCYVNTWPWGGDRQYAGFRPFGTNIGAMLSQHKFGRGFDPTFENYASDGIRQDIIENYGNGGWWGMISAIEEDVSWLHFDTRNSTEPRLIRFKP